MSDTIHAFAERVCLGNLEALQFCDLWFRYCHSIDDLIDTMEDGRPTMKPEAIIEIFAVAAGIYNCSFYIKNQPMLMPVVLLVTSAYADSVQFEKSPVNCHRKIGDVLRCCGNEMFFAVAMITGGWRHARGLSPAIREASWKLQHDENDNPLVEDFVIKET